MRNSLNKKLTIIGAYYDFKNEFNKGYGRIIITNVNKNKDKNQILDLSEFKEVRNNVNKIYIGRLIEWVNIG